MTLSHFARAAAPLAMLIPLSSAYAEDARDQTIIVTAPEVRDAAEQAARETPGGTDIVGYADYADKAIVSLRDTLAFSPGVYLQPRFGQEIRISIRGSGLSRGFHMRGLTLLQDGVPTNLADDNGDFQELDPVFFDHLEVYRGANALRFGSGTLGGAINGVTPNGASAEGLFLRGDMGRFNMARGLISAGVKGGAGDGWGAVSVDRSDGDRDQAKRRSVRFHGNIGLAISDVVDNRLYVSFNNINQQLPGALTRSEALTTPRKANASSLAGNQARDIDSLRIQDRLRFDWGALTLDVGGFVNAKSLYHPIFQVLDQESVDRGGFFRADFSYEWFSATFGGELRVGEVQSKRFINVSGQRGAKAYEAKQYARSATLYGELRVTPTPTVSLIAGGIYADGMRKQQENFSLFAGGIVDNFGRADFSAFSPKVGLIYEPNSNIQFFANYSRSVEFPGFIELAQIATFVPLDAQTAWTAEIGTRGKHGMISWDLAAYRATINGELLQFTVNANVPASTFNAGHTLHQGIEAGVDLAPTDWLRLRQTYSYNDFRFRNDAQYGDNRLPVAPRHTYRAELRIGTDRLHITPNVEWVPKGGFADYRNQLRTPGYALIGLTGGIQIVQNIDVFVDVRNIAGKKAIGDISAVLTADATSAIFYPVERSAVSGGIRARF